MLKRLVVGISGASGAIYGIRLLQVLAADPAVETHLVISSPGARTIAQETDWSVPQVEALADAVHPNADIGAPVASGSFLTAGMVIAPCSVKSLSAVAHSYADNLMARAADVTLKEGRPLVLLFRETPLHVGHIRLMARAAEAGAVLFPPVPAFYGRPASIAELVDDTVGRVLLRLGVENPLFTRWKDEAV
jgi:4-hydroxy-3-polyprenylbenzoate decarboxylase